MGRQDWRVVFFFVIPGPPALLRAEPGIQLLVLSDGLTDLDSGFGPR
jgi:hypothetical protein